ncbi:MAG TPA: YncE family protein [Terriglobales bacterium]|nr:YncE family protein [Terriglobales bacterium]
MRTRHMIVALLLTLLTVTAGWAAPQSQPPFQKAATYALGGEGGWDYVTYDPDGNRLFIAHGKEILVADAASGKKLGAVPAEGAHGTALVPDLGRGFSTNGRAGTVTVFDLHSLKPIQDIKVGEGPDAIIYDPNSKRVVVMHGRSKDVMAIDPAAMKVVATVPLGGKLEFAAADKDHVYVNLEDKGEIADVDSRTWTVAQRWKLADCEEPSGLALDTEGHRLFAVCGNKKMQIVDARNGKLIASVPTGGGTDAAAYDPGLKLAFASNGEGTLTVVRETKGGQYEVAENVTTQRGARTMALDPKTHTVFLPTAELGPPAEGQRRPTIKPDTFMILVYRPAK